MSNTTSAATATRPASIPAYDRDPRAWMQAHYDAWRRSDPEEILAWYADDVEIWLNGGAQRMQGKAAARDQFVVPYCGQQPGMDHHIEHLIAEGRRVAVEITYRGVEARSGRKVEFPSGNFYVVTEDGRIRVAHLYSNAKLMEQQLGAD